MDFKTRYNGIHAAGMTKIRSGDFTLWTGLPAGDRHNPFVAVVPQISDEAWAFFDKIVRSARINDVDLFLAVRDFPLHFTVSLAKMDTHSFSKVPTSAETLLGQEWDFGDVSLGPNGIIGSDTAPAMLAPIREEIESVMQSMGFGNVTSPDIVHGTIYRIMRYESRQSLSSFISDMGWLRGGTAEKPLRLTVKRIVWGLVGDFLDPK